jgi:hypothetical protein
VLRPLALRRSNRWSLAAAAAAAAVFGVAVGLATLAVLPWTQALFTAPQVVDGNVSTARIFRDERVTPAFGLADYSSGGAVDGSSSTAFAADGRYFSSRPWAASFESERYLELDFNSPLPAGLAASGAQVNVRLASDSAAATACYYVQLRRASDGALLSTHGSAGSPVACATGTTFQAATVNLPGVSGTDALNDLRVRILAADSAAGAVRVDSVTISGTTPYAGFTLYPILTREAYAGSLELIRWGPAGP